MKMLADEIDPDELDVNTGDDLDTEIDDDTDEPEDEPADADALSELRLTVRQKPKRRRRKRRRQRAAERIADRLSKRRRLRTAAGKKVYALQLKGRRLARRRGLAPGRASIRVEDEHQEDIADVSRIDMLNVELAALADRLGVDDVDDIEDADEPRALDDFAIYAAAAAEW